MDRDVSRDRLEKDDYARAREKWERDRWEREHLDRERSDRDRSDRDRYRKRSRSISPFVKAMQAWDKFKLAEGAMLEQVGKRKALYLKRPEDHPEYAKVILLRVCP